MFEEPTYEEYRKATAFAKIRYKYGLIVQIIAILFLILLIYFIYSYGEELVRNPLIYGADKANAECNCFMKDTGQRFFVNGSTIKLQKEMIYGDFRYIEGLGEEE